MHRKQMFRIILGILAIMALTLILGGSAWAAGKYKTIHRFNKQTGVRGRFPSGSLIFDANGNLYGITEHGGAFGYGTVFELTPNRDGSWKKRVLHSFRRNDGRNPGSGLIFDAAGNLYGTTVLWRRLSRTWARSSSSRRTGMEAGPRESYIRLTAATDIIPLLA